MRLIEVVLHGVGLVGELALQFLINRQFFGDSLDETLDFHMVLILPRILFSPVRLEVLLHDLHLFNSGFLSIFLHTCVDGGVDFQTAGIEVVTVFLAPMFQVVGHCLAEILCLTVVVALHFVVEFGGNLAQ